MIDFKLDLCTCMCMRHLLMLELNNEGMLKKERERTHSPRTNLILCPFNWYDNTYNGYGNSHAMTMDNGILQQLQL